MADGVSLSRLLYTLGAIYSIIDKRNVYSETYTEGPDFFMLVSLGASRLCMCECIYLRVPEYLFRLPRLKSA